MPGSSCFVVLFSAFLCLCVIHNAEGQPKICYLDGGYDTNTLREVPYWTVRVDSKFNCPYFNPSTNKNCVMYLSFCQALPISDTEPAGFCRFEDLRNENPKDASICMVIDGILNSSSATFGTYQPLQVPFEPLRIGFESISTEGRAFASTCTQTQSFVQFRCDPTADWSTADRNITKYLLSAGFDRIEPCFFTMTFAYKGACVVPLTTLTPTVPPGHCYLDGGYDVNTLRSVPYWTVRMDSKFQCPFFSPSTNKNCVMYLSFCQTLPLNDAEPAGFCRWKDAAIGYPTNASMCMVIDGTLDKQTTSTFGQYLPQLVEFKPLLIEDNRTGFESISTEGRAFAATCTQTQSFVQFRCDPTADWSTADRNITKYLLSAGFDRFESCFFVMNFAYKGACVEVPIPPKIATRVGVDGN